MDSMKDRKGTGDLKQFISFSIGEEEYGLELLRVKEVIRIREITWLPKAPSFVKGLAVARRDKALCDRVHVHQCVKLVHH